MEMITLTINGQTVQAPKNATILEAARSARHSYSYVVLSF